MSDRPHETVLLDVACDALMPRAGGLYLDCTLGRGGHAREILERSGPDGRVIGLDRDPAALAAVRESLAGYGDRLELHQLPFSRAAEALAGRKVDGVLADLGVSSPQLDDPERGMSFRHEGPLDMRMGDDVEETAYELVRRLKDDALADVIYEYGEERASRPIARSIKRAIDEGAMETTKHLADAVHRVLGWPRFGKPDTATRTFQALRIAVNDELGELERLLAALPSLVKEGGRVVVISFHSLEDRIVKHTLRDEPAWQVVTKKPVEPTEAEGDRNPRSRSAKMRVAVRRTEEGEQ
ncbi:MAG: 16S rRNA (cytosine(1402)-N(4))-methyltransferase RsmH [Deltaproteobacteria bacterium]|nr:16S rRNA (cytosine(1402)-N(4))-methyltransferase RsmH [Deltaproteobacteria bacterium]